MARKNLLDSRALPYHVTARGNNKDPFPGSLDIAWKILTDELFLRTVESEIRIHAFVMMPNHIHLLATFIEFRVDTVMRDFISPVTRILNTRTGRSGRIFGGPYHWSLIRDPLYFAHALKYVYRNPVKAGICVRVEDYPYSTISGLMGYSALPIPILKPLNDFGCLVPSVHNSISRLESWLNTPHRIEQQTAIQNALRRREFDLAVDRSTRRKVELELPS